MPSGTDYIKLYGQANAAYCQGNLEEASAIIEQMKAKYPDDPNILLLQGHIHLGLQQFDLAKEKYKTVLRLAKHEDTVGRQSDLVNYAQRGLEQARQAQSHFNDLDFALEETEGISISEPGFDPNQHFSNDWHDSDDEVGENWNNERIDWDSSVFNEDDLDEPTLGQIQPLDNPFADYPESYSESFSETKNSAFDDINAASAVSRRMTVDWSDNNLSEDDFPFLDEDAESAEHLIKEEFADTGESTFVVSSDLRGNSLNNSARFLEADNAQATAFSSYVSETSTDILRGTSSAHNPSISRPTASSLKPSSEQHPEKVQTSTQTDNFLDNLENLSEEELNNLSQIDITDVTQSFTDISSEANNPSTNRPTMSSRDSSLFTHSDGDLSSGIELESEDRYRVDGTASQLQWTDISEIKNPPLTSPNISERLLKPMVEVHTGKLKRFINAPLRTKQLMTAAAAGITSTVVILVISSAAWLSTPKGQPIKEENVAATPKNKVVTSQDKAKKPTSSSTNTATISPFSQPILLMMLLSGLGSFAATWLVGHLATSHIKRTLNDLQTQFDGVCEGNFNVKATIYSEDEMGHLANRFNQMARNILTTTTEAQRRAAETEQAKEDLQRQVIRLLDDVEGAARGDLTVEAEVTADVLGAVADAFNLTIQNLREIVRQVKKAAKQVNKGSTDSELFARNQSSDALRMAEELAVTLNSVQMMTESIQRVSENAREAEEVARTSSITALKGGESVERTVAGILQIRETVSETARKVKRLAEASQEISKIVALISQIASRTNLLALNASIQAARAGEAGRGFAIVADEVRQLADRSAKSLKEIEQIVLQIQSETGSVMTAMEEGIQQVIDVTERSEQAKKSLEDIIQVSNRIDSLVRSITGDTVKQRENSREVAQVMQSVELTAQETSQESQRVAGSLQKLVSISRDLLFSVERFNVDMEEGAK